MYLVQLQQRLLLKCLWKHRPIVLKTKQNYLWNLFREIVLCVWSDVQKIVHCFFYEIVKDHRYPFNFTQLLGRRLFNGNNNVILARWTRCSFNYSVWLRLNEIVLSGSFKKKKRGYTWTFLCHDYALIRLCIRSRRLHRTIGVQSEFESHATEFCKSLKKSKSALTFPVGASG